ncbi:uncharacterized protein BDV14DRAFT_200181 [Aspergillus stella-maris]|uniref:uncharacterized protein n=1 Tax=Aspergillus stella-maris TaxID=1810926 RepID=UPI003CCE07E2
MANRTWLHDRPKEEVYKLLIDSYCLYIADRWELSGVNEPDSIYGGQPDSRIGFHHFLVRAGRSPRLLPRWWSKKNSAECFSRGLVGGWSSLATKVDSKAVTQHYRDNFMSAQLKHISMLIYGGEYGIDRIGILEKFLSVKVCGEF